MGKELKKLPVGIDIFEDVIKGDYYYVDKTTLIKNIIQEEGKVTLFTRPRRFGKTLNMSMLKNFFGIDSEKTLFKGLKISEDKEFCDKYQGQFPVIFVSLKDVDGLGFEDACFKFCNTIFDLANSFNFLAESEKLSQIDKERYQSLLKLESSKVEINARTLEILSSSLYILTELLYRHYGRKAVVLIDEYDVPLDKAHTHHYYDEMLNLLRGMLHKVLKTNSNLAFGVLTGCLRISRESIFTGMNKLSVNSITAKNNNATFGFTEKEIDEMLSYYNLSEKKQEVKEWYDGYRFGKAEIYCPWDAINYCQGIISGKIDRPTSYWSNTSSNSLVREFVDLATERTSNELERLVAGEQIHKTIKEELTYRDINDSIENMWSILYLTGYLTGYQVDDNTFVLWIPNREIQEIFENDIDKWFEEKVKSDKDSGMRFFEAVLKEKPEEMEDVLSGLLFESISIRDTFVQKHLRENFYHGFILGLLTDFKDIRSNPESGNGYSDIMILNRKEKIAAILELKYSDSDSEKDMEKCCLDAIAQIDDKKYALSLTRSGIAKKIIKYGISFNKKLAMVREG